MLGAKTGHKGANVREVCPKAFVERLAKHLEANRIIVAPDWADLAKTSCHCEMPPCAQNWWYTRAASIARQVYLHPGTSVTSLRNRYGFASHNTVAPLHHTTASGKVVRACLKQLETIGWVKVAAGKGRVITKEGQKQLDAISKEVAKSCQ